MKLSPISRFKIEENSMLPAYVPGDRVVTLNWSQINIGDAVVFVDNKAKLIKRVADYKDGLYLLKGDNIAQSTTVYEVARDKIIGKVFYKY